MGRPRLVNHLSRPAGKLATSSARSSENAAQWHPMYICQEPNLLCFYNDAYSHFGNHAFVSSRFPLRPASRMSSTLWRSEIAA
jgi:hypothetical protein